MTALLAAAAKRLPADQLWVNPDCGLKTRKWPEVQPAIENMVAARPRRPRPPKRQTRGRGARPWPHPVPQETNTMETMVTPTLHRWLAGQRIGPLPARNAAQPVPLLSFEFFPPRTEALDQQLWTCIHRLEPLRPRFVSVTYGAGGTTHARTHATVSRLARETNLVPAAHLTCVGATREEVDEVARGYWEAGVRHIVALRGDPPPGTQYTPHPGGYAYAADLVAGLKRVADFEISVAAYPETHPTAHSPGDDLDNLKRKLDAGATRAITQYFFDTATYLRFLERLPGCRHHRADRARYHARVQLRPGGQVLQDVRDRGAGLARHHVRGHGGRPGDPPHRRQHRRRRAGPGAAGQWRGRVPLLHAEPPRFDLCHRAYPGRPPRRDALTRMDQRIVGRAMRHVFLRDMVLSASIGIYPHEHAARQRIRVNIDLGVADDPTPGMSRPAVGRDELGRVVNYERVAQAVRDIVAAGHVMLVETLAERIAEASLSDARVLLARVRVEKLDVFADMASAGVEIERRNTTAI